MERYRGMAREQLDVAYNNRAVVPDWQGYLDRWTAKGHETYKQATVRDLKYGPGSRQRIDLFLTEDENAPTCLFLHGGYWQWNDKEGQAIVADGLLPNGINAAIGEYTLAPNATMTEICQEAVDQVKFLSAELEKRGRNPNNIYLSGISTGAHLMACALDLDCVRGALLISGIYDLEPIRISSLNGPIRMDWEEARSNSPLHAIPDRLPPVVITHGALERPEIRRQSTDYFNALVSLDHEVSLVPVAESDHFSVLETFSAPDGVLAAELVRLVERTRLA